MKNQVIKIISIEILYLIILLLNIIFKFFSPILLIVSLITLLIINKYILGFEKEKIVNKKLHVISIILFTLVLLILKYTLGLITGYLVSSYDLSFIGILRNVLPVIAIIILSEINRYELIKNTNNIFIYILTIIIFTLIYTYGISGFEGLDTLGKIIRYLSTIGIVNLINNILLTIFCKKYGYTVSIIYSIIINTYVFIIPIVPDLGKYNDTISALLIGLFTYLLMNFTLGVERKKDIRDNYLVVNIVRFTIILLIVAMIGLNSNLFRYSIAVVGSGSMMPTIKIGDAIIVDKSYSEKAYKIEVGDILVFKKENELFCHRVVEKNMINDSYYFKTKGDREGQEIDNWVVKEDEIVGVTNFQIKNIGMPSIWLKNIMEG